MAPLRRYLRITKYSVLECRIYLDNPALAHSWLLNPRDPVLPKVIEAIRPFVLPKLREERERSRKKSTKKRGIKDTVAQDDFEVSIFLTETNTRHSLLYKHKHFRDTTQTKLTSNSTKLTGASKDAPIDVDNQAEVAAPPAAIREGVTPVRVLREEDDDDDVVPLHDIPSIQRDETTAAAEVASPPVIRASKRRRGRTEPRQKYNGSHSAELDTGAPDSSQGAGPSSVNVVVDSDDDDGLFVTDHDESEEEDGYRRSDLTVELDDDDDDDDDDENGDNSTAPPPAKRRKNNATLAAENGPEEAQRDDKKKLAMDISYEGFSIYGRVLCLVIKRRDGYAGTKGKGKAVATTSSAAATTTTTTPGRGGARAGQFAAPGGQAVMENWITSTQMPADAIAE